MTPYSLEPPETPYPSMAWHLPWPTAAFDRGSEFSGWSLDWRWTSSWPWSPLGDD